MQLRCRHERRAAALPLGVLECGSGRLRAVPAVEQDAKNFPLLLQAAGGSKCAEHQQRPAAESKQQLEPSVVATPGFLLALWRQLLDLHSMGLNMSHASMLAPAPMPACTTGIRNSGTHCHPNSI